MVSFSAGGPAVAFDPGHNDVLARISQLFGAVVDIGKRLRAIERSGPYRANAFCFASEHAYFLWT